VYKVNDLPVFTIKAKEDCHLTLINVDGKGEGTVIFPNKFQQDNLLPAGKEAQFPGATAPFQFRLKDPGTETVIAICNATGKEADGIKHDFKKRQFTELGNYRDFLTRQIVVEGAEKIAEGKSATKSDEKKADAVAPAAPASDILSRTAIKLEVK
jgi:3-dehydroquinate synthase class II